MTDNDWVCELQTRATDLFTLGCVGLILGTAVFSWLADAKGRRLAFFLSTIAMIIFQMIQIWVSHSYGAFLAMKILAFACMLPLFQTPMSITTEISSIKGTVFENQQKCLNFKKISKFIQKSKNGPKQVQKPCSLRSQIFEK